jgi:hypothetical protein
VAAHSLLEKTFDTVDAAAPAAEAVGSELPLGYTLLVEGDWFQVDRALGDTTYIDHLTRRDSVALLSPSSQVCIQGTRGISSYIYSLSSHT